MAFSTLSALLNIAKVTVAQVDVKLMFWQLHTSLENYFLYLEAGSRTLLATISQATHNLTLCIGSSRHAVRLALRGSPWVPRFYDNTLVRPRALTLDVGPRSFPSDHKYDNPICPANFNGTTSGAFGFLAAATTTTFATATLAATQATVSGAKFDFDAFPTASDATVENVVVIGFILVLLGLSGVVIWVDASTRKEEMALQAALEAKMEANPCEFQINNIIEQIASASRNIDPAELANLDVSPDVDTQQAPAGHSTDVPRKDMETRQVPADDNKDTTLGHTATHASTSAGPSSSSSESLVSEEIHTVSEDMKVEWDEVLESVPAFSTPARVRRGSAPPTTRKAHFSGPLVFSRSVLAVEGDEASSSTKKKKTKTKKKVSRSASI
ncbi:hypothetical protein BDW22DRAFT_1426830 [Trametopsis cervina]|nr:hypothetical protein BDW22DRAFT_1426830 [Trametopsis cervina]